MSDHLAFLQSVADPAARRLWLLYRALECAAFDQAIDWARRAEEFITAGIGLGAAAAPAASASAPPPSAHAAAAATAVAGAPRIERPSDAPAPVAAARDQAAAAPAATISVEQRSRLIERLAQGRRNAELADEFALTTKQIQGVRMGCARQIAARRAALVRPAEATRPTAIVVPVAGAAKPGAPVVATVDEVVRYLRQQDDVVVPQGGDEFLVNARFRLPLVELVSRANRIRARQGKPEFVLTNASNGHAATAAMASLTVENSRAVA